MRIKITVTVDTIKCIYVEAKTVKDALITASSKIHDHEVMEHDHKLSGEKRRLLVNPPIIGRTPTKKQNASAIDKYMVEQAFMD